MFCIQEQVIQNARCPEDFISVVDYFPKQCYAVEYAHSHRPYLYTDFKHLMQTMIIHQLIELFLHNCKSCMCYIWWRGKRQRRRRLSDSTLIVHWIYYCMVALPTNGQCKTLISYFFFNFIQYEPFNGSLMQK